MNEFYVYLPSNSSHQHFPDNTVSHFCTRLRKPLDLSGEYEVALVEVTLPTLWKNIDHKRCRLAINMDGKSWQEFGVTQGFYDSNTRFLTELARVTEDATGGNKLLHYDDRQRKLSVVLPDNTSLKLYKGLAEILGFKNAKLLHGPRTLRPSGTVDVNHGVYLLYVYVNIVESQLVGDAEVPLLRTVFFNAAAKKNKASEMAYTNYTSPHYVRVNKSFVQDIEIDIRDHTGERVPFLVGPSNVKLHFRQIRPSFIN